jgi:hypothetical protein
MKIMFPTMMATLALATTLLQGCTGSSNSSGDAHVTSDTALKATLGTQPVDPALVALDPQFYVAYADGGRAYKLGFSMGAGSPVARRVRGLDARIMSDDSEIATLHTDEINTSGTSNTESGEMSGIMYGSMEWAPSDIPTPGTYVVLTLRGDSGVVIRRVELPGPPRGDGDNTPMPVVEQIPHDRILNLTLTSERRGAGVQFTLSVKRQAPAPAGEYLPSGEEFRIELRNANGENIWSSSDGRFFVQKVGTVEPATVGGEVVYRAQWDGRNDLLHAPAAPGTYRITATIPAKPTPYILREEFTWNGR